jgi:hypothetical protein
MSETNSPGLKVKCGLRPRQAGVAAVEFAAVFTVFLAILFGIIEFARAIYMYNTLAEVTRRAARAAANIDFRDGNALDLARKHAVLDDTSGVLPFGNPITYQNIRIEYLYLGSKGSGQELQLIPGGSMPGCPAKNRVNCMTAPNSVACVRAVQARICQEAASGGACTPVPYQSLTGLVSLPLTLPMSTTIVSAETLGYVTGDTPCP